MDEVKTREAVIQTDLNGLPKTMEELVQRMRFKPARSIIPAE